MLLRTIFFTSTHATINSDNGFSGGFSNGFSSRYINVGFSNGFSSGFDAVYVLPLPVTPVLSTSTITSSTLTVTWTMSDDVSIADYIVEYKASSSGTWLVFSDGTSTVKTATITGLPVSTSYDVRVKAVNATGNSDYSNTVTSTTDSATTSARAIYGTANSVYSLRKLNSSYTGQCIRVRRSNDNVEADIGFNNNVLDTAALLTFTGSNSAFVTTVYAQVTGSSNLLQPTAANQPRIVNAGVLDTLPVSGRPALKSDGTQWLFSTTGLIAGSTGATFSVVGSYAVLAGNYKMLGNIANIEMGTGGSVTNLYWGAAGNASTTGTVLSTSTPYILTGNTGASSTSAPNWRNGSQSATTLTLSLITTRTVTVLGSRGSTALSSALIPNGYWSEQVSTSTILSSTDRRIIEADQGAYYGITITTLPVAPVLATPTATDTTLALTWTMSNDTGVTDYVIQYKASSSGTWLTFSDGTSTAKSATITGLTASTSYDVRVNAVTGAGNGDYSNVQTLSTSAASFSPTSITGLRLWIDGNDASTITSSGGLISQINDKSGQNNHIVQATGSRQPTYDGTAKSINFDGGDWLDRASFGMFNNGSVTCFAVTSDRVFVNADTLFAETGTSDFYTFQRLTGSGLTSTQIRVNAVTLLNDISLNGTNLVPTAKHIQTYKDTGSLMTYYENGVVGSSPQTYTRLISATMDRFALGGRIQSGADDRTINAKVYELLIYFGALSNSDINLIGNYLNTKWSVSWTNL